MSEAWEYYLKVTLEPLESAPLCVHQLVNERTKVAYDLLGLILADCREGMPRETWKALQSALVAVKRLQGTLTRQRPCTCQRHQGQEERDEDATAPDELS